MVQASEAFESAILKNRTFYYKVRIILTSGEELSLTNRQLLSFKVSDAISSDSSFDIGAAIINKFTCVIDNSDMGYIGMDFSEAEVYPFVGLQIGDSVEWIAMGVYSVDGSPRADITINLECLDRMSRFEKDYSLSTLDYPATINQVISNAAQDCGVSVGTIPNGSFVLNEKPTGAGMTYLIVVSECAKISGCYARAGRDGTVTFNDYAIFDEETWDGGQFDTGDPYYLTGNAADGGDFTYTSGDDVGGGAFGFYSKIHHAYDTQSLSAELNPVQVTGVVVKNNDLSYSAGSKEGYVLEIESLLMTEGNGQSIADYLNNRLTGLMLHNLSVKSLSNPCVEAGDLIEVSDRKGNSYVSILTRLEYGTGSTETFISSCETLSENQSSTYKRGTKILQKASKESEQRLSSYDQTAQNMTSLISQGFGLYTTTVTDEAGGVKQYLHDKPTLEASSVIWTRTTQGLMVSKDGMTSWAVDSNGNALFNVLTAHGINADWVRVGGLGNGDGQIVVKNAAGDTIILLNNAGITMADGTSLINAAGVCGDLTFTSGGTPYDLGWAGNTIATGNFIKQDVLLQAYIPENYVITSAQLVLSTCATSWTSVMDDSGGGSLVYNTCTGYPRGIKAYIGAQQMYKSAVWDGEYTLGTSGAMSQIVSGGFTSAGVDGSATTSPKQIVSGDIKSLLTSGLNTIRFTVADFTGSTNLSYAQRTGTATALLSVKGYTKN